MISGRPTRRFSLALMCASACAFGLPSGSVASQKLLDSEILPDADSRIEKIRKGNLVLALRDESGKPMPSGTKVHLEQLRHKFLFGANLFRFGSIDAPAEEQAYRDRFAALMNYATVPFYWRMYEPVKGQPEYGKTDRMVAWCERNGITMKGHPLAWNLADPDWLKNSAGDARSLLMERVTACSQRFRGSIRIWDAVNELTAYDRPAMREDAPIQTAVIDRMGKTEYARAVFRAAREGNAGATLLINDYLTGPRFQELLPNITDSSGRLAFDAVGMQAHQHTGVWAPSEIQETCDRLSSFGKPVHITETTILSGPLQGVNGPPSSGWDTTPEGEQLQSEQVKTFYTMAFSHPRVEAITWWDFTDRDAWKKAPAGLLRRDMTPKPAYFALHSLVKNKWWSRTDTVVDAKGEARARLFFGDYTLTAQAGTRTLRGPIPFQSESSHALGVTLR